jgi:phage shock protein PspC (stress-responsive transcriptional regulator)
MEKKLYKSKNRVISGVCGGIAEYFGIDPTLVRIGWALLIFFGGSGILIYIICACIMPDNPGTKAPPPPTADDNSQNRYTN